MNKLKLRQRPVVFSQLMGGVMLALGLALVGLAVATMMSGPRLRSATIDVAAVTTKNGQRITLHANQPLAKITPTAVQLTPAAPVSVAAAADTITITLKQRLRYDTTYTVVVNGVAGVSRPGKQSIFTYHFTTIDQPVFFLKRAGTFTSTGHDDRIMLAGLFGSSQRTVFSAPHIIDYAVLGNSLVVSTADRPDTSKLQIIDITTGQGRQIGLPVAGLVENLRTSPNGTGFGFTLTSPKVVVAGGDDYFQSLLLDDVRPGYRAAPLFGLDDRLLSVFDWQFAPDGTSVVALQEDQTLLLVDSTGAHRPVPLGSFSSLANFSADGSHLLVRGGDGFGLLDLVHHGLLPLANSQVVDGLTTLLDVSLLPGDNGVLRHYQVTSDDRTTFSDYFRYDHGSTKTVIYNTVFDKSSIQAYTVSPNDQLAFIETAPQYQTDYDGYPGSSRPLSTQTRIIDIASGKLVKRLDGIQPRLP